MPIEKVLDDCLLVYAQNGEMLRAENGYPLRLFVPGWEGNVSVKWLRRIKVGDQPWHFRSETARYTDPMPDGKWRQFSFEMECKSVITRPSGGMKLDSRACTRSRASRGRATARSRAVDVTRRRRPDLAGGEARRAGAGQVPDAFRFRVELGRRPGEIASRAVDSTGYVQPTVAGHRRRSRAIVGFVQHHNGIHRGRSARAGR